MAYYNNTRKARELSTDLEISYVNYLNKRQKEFENDFVPQIMDTRTKYEKLKNKDYIKQQLRKMSYNLFDNDPKYSELFINMFNIDNVNYSKFSVIYDDLVKQFKGTDVLPSFVLQTAKTLIKNIEETGTTSGFNNAYIVENLQQLKEDLKDYNFYNKFEETETINKLNAMIYLYKNVFDDSSSITFNTTNKLSKQQFLNIRNKMISETNEIIQYLVSNDIDEQEKHKHILRLMSEIKTKSITQITNLIQNKEITIK